MTYSVKRDRVAHETFETFEAKLQGLARDRLNS